MVNLNSGMLKNLAEEVTGLEGKITIQISDSNAHGFLVQHTSPVHKGVKHICPWLTSKGDSTRVCTVISSGQ